MDTTKEPCKNDSKYTIYSTLDNFEVVFVNYKEESVKCKVQRTLIGTLTASDPDVKSKLEKIVKPHDTNPQAKYVWEINVNPQENSKLAFSCSCISRQRNDDGRDGDSHKRAIHQYLTQAFRG